MTPSDAITHYVNQHPTIGKYCIAYSGGVDSHVLLALMARLRNSRATFNVRAIHIDHGLQADSATWAEHARQICAELDIPLEVCRCNVDPGTRGPEAAARRSRYVEFARVLQPGEHLLLAQHAEDQAETFLLQALRGSGPDGLAGIPSKRDFGKGTMARPLLGCSQESLLVTAHKMDLDWIEDPSNQQLHFDRNFLRLRVMPMIKARWPAAAQTLSRSAVRSAAASQALLSMSKDDLDSVKVSGRPELKVSALKKLPRERTFAAIRLWVRQRGLLMPRLQDLKQVHSDLINARVDSNGIVNVRDYEFRRNKDSLYLLLPQAATKPFRYSWKAPFEDLFIAETGTTITLGECFRQGIRLPDVGSVIVKSRAGGELIRLGDPEFHKSVKKILQESTIPPWQRESVPLFYINNKLAAVWQHAVAADFRRKLSVGKLPERPSVSEKNAESDKSTPAESRTRPETSHQ